LSLLRRGASRSSRARESLGGGLLRRRLLRLGGGLLGRRGLGRRSLSRRSLAGAGRFLGRRSLLRSRRRGGFERLGRRLSVALRSLAARRALAREQRRDNQQHLHDNTEREHTNGNTCDERERGIHLRERLLGGSLGGELRGFHAFKLRARVQRVSRRQYRIPRRSRLARRRARAFTPPSSVVRVHAAPIDARRPKTTERGATSRWPFQNAPSPSIAPTTKPVPPTPSRAVPKRPPHRAHPTPRDAPARVVPDATPDAIARARIRIGIKKNQKIHIDPSSPSRARVDRAVASSTVARCSTPSRARVAFDAPCARGR
ncbi:hypothetical protein BE221DRAFT_162696, partial [Ostreococcus tauri]